MCINNTEKRVCDFIFVVCWGVWVGCGLLEELELLWGFWLVVLDEFLECGFPVWELLADGVWDGGVWGIGAVGGCVCVDEFCVREGGSEPALVLLCECVPAWWDNDGFDVRGDGLDPEAELVVSGDMFTDVEALCVCGGCFYGMCSEWECFDGECVLEFAGFDFEFYDDG